MGSERKVNNDKFCSEFSVRVIWGSSTARCHATFRSVRHITLWCITFGVIRYSTLPSRPTPAYSTSWDSPVRGSAPSSISGSFVARCYMYYPRLYSRLIVPLFGGPRHFQLRAAFPLRLLLSRKSTIDSTTASALVDSSRLLENNPSPSGLQPNFQAPRPPTRA